MSLLTSNPFKMRSARAIRDALAGLVGSVVNVEVYPYLPDALPWEPVRIAKVTGVYQGFVPFDPVAGDARWLHGLLLETGSGPLLVRWDMLRSIEAPEPVDPIATL